MANLLVLFLSMTFMAHLIIGGGSKAITIEPMGEPYWFMADNVLNLTCIAPNAKEKPVWIFGSSDEPVDAKYVTDKALPGGGMSSQLYMDEASVNDVGTYLCQAGNDVVTRKVQMLSVTARDVNLTLSFSTSITCDVEPNYNEKSIRWFKGKVPVSEVPGLENRLTRSGGNKTLTISSSKHSDAGLYTCTVEFNPGTPLAKIFSQQVGIVGRPYLLKTEKTTLVHVTNSSVILECPSGGYPLPEVFWMKGDDVIEPSSRYEFQAMNDVPNARLVIKDPDDKNNYVCSAENLIGKTSMAFEVENFQNGGSSLSSVAMLPVAMTVILILRKGFD